MNPESPLGMLVFFCIFELIGGAALGAGLRGVRRGNFMEPGCFVLVWGAGFAGIPLLLGALTFLNSDRPALFFAQLFVLLITVLVVALMPDELLESSAGDSGGEYNNAIVGAVMAMLGSAVVLFTWREGFGLGLIAGALVAVVGAFLLIRSTVAALRSL